MNSMENQTGTASTKELDHDHDEEENLSQYALQLASASVLPMVLKATIELGVLEIIQRAGPGALLSPSQIASQIPTQSNADSSPLLDSMLRLLTTHSILTCSTSTHQHDGHVLRLYGLAPVSKYFIRNQDGRSMAPFLDMIQDKVIMDIWYHLKDAVLEGGVPFYKAHGMNAMEYVGKDARFYEVFKGSMEDFHPMLMKKILETYKGFAGLKSLVDVGGGDATILNMIISKYPTINGVNFDLPPVIEKSPSYPGIEHVAGDMFATIPKGDAIFMKWILHSWDDKNCLKILRNCYEALPDHGKVIVVDVVNTETTATTNADKSLSQLYLVLTNINQGGKERTERELESLAKEAGFSGVQVACRAYDFSVVELYKNM